MLVKLQVATSIKILLVNYKLQLACNILLERLPAGSILLYRLDYITEEREIHTQTDTQTGGYRDRWIQRERPADIETGGYKDRLIQRQVDIESDGYAEADGYRDRWIQRQVDIETGGYTEADGYRDRWI